MVRDVRNSRIKTAVTVAAALFAVSQVSPVQAQSIMRTPSLHINSRVPTINPTVAPGSIPVSPDGPALRSIRSPARHRPPPCTLCRACGIRSTLPYARYSPNLYPACDYAYRGSDGECFDRPVADGGGKGKDSSTKKGNGGPRNNASQTAVNLRSVPNELMAEIDGALTDAQADELARRHGLTRLQSQNFPLLGATIGLFRITDRRPVETVRRELRRRRQRPFGAAQFPLFAAGPESGVERGRSLAICARAASIAAGPHACPWHERHCRRDRFRYRRRPSRIGEFDRRQPLMRLAARKGRTFTAPASPARSLRIRG